MSSKLYFLKRESKLIELILQSILKQYQCQPSATTIIIDDIRLKAGKRVYSLTKSC